MSNINRVPNGTATTITKSGARTCAAANRLGIQHANPSEILFFWSTSPVFSQLVLVFLRAPLFIDSLLASSSLWLLQSPDCEYLYQTTTTTSVPRSTVRWSRIFARHLTRCGLRLSHIAAVWGKTRLLSWFETVKDVRVWSFGFVRYPKFTATLTCTALLLALC